MEIMKKIYSELLSQGNYLQISKKMIAVLGLEMAVFITALIDKYDYFYNQHSLIEDSFYFTDNDILISTGLNANKIQNLKVKGEELNLFYIKKLGNPTKTYYTINFQEINNIFVSNKSTRELYYERIFKEKIDINNINYEVLNNLSRKELQLFCKQQKITYFGKYTKNELIQNILDKINSNELEKTNFKNILENLPKRTVLELREICKKLNISYTGNDNKKSLIEKITSQKIVDDFITKNVGNKCTESLVTSDQKNWYNQYQITITNKQKQNHNHDIDEFENLFSEFGINFTNKNKNSIKKLLKTMSFLEVRNYLKETFENIKSNPNVKNIAALFSNKIAKGERQIKYISPRVNEKKELSKEKQQWLSNYSGIMTNIELKEEIQNILIEIPIERLKKNSSYLSSINIPEFKSALYKLKYKDILP